MIYVGSKTDEPQQPTIMYVGSDDNALTVKKIYIGNENGEATLVWVAPAP